MKTKRLVWFLLVVALLAAFNVTLIAFASSPDLVEKQVISTPFSVQVGPVDAPAGGRQAGAAWGEAQAGEAIIIDHTCTDLSQIPDDWLQEARKLTLHYGHTSHGSQIISGLERLAQVDARYSVDIVVGRLPSSAPGSATVLGIYDGNNYGENSYITPEMYWREEDGRTHTRAVAATGFFDYSMWAWCGQMGGDSTPMNTYLQTLNQFNAQYPATRFIYMTGHADSTGAGGTAYANRQLILNHVNANGEVLYDFWDIDSYDPDGVYHGTNDEGECLWCVDWCDSHPADCTNLPHSCAHSESTASMRYTCKLKGNAFWWMMARLAGWPGPGRSRSYLPIIMK